MDFEFTEHLLDAVERDASLHVVIGLHSFVSGPEEIAPALFRGARLPARLVAPRGPFAIEDGFGWFRESYYDAPHAGQLVELRERAAQLAGFAMRIRERFPEAPSITMTGVSQGGDLSLAVALFHPGILTRAVPIAARFPAAFHDAVPKGPPRTPIALLHGAEDRTADVDEMKAAFAFLRSEGCPVTLDVFPGLAHGVDDALRARLRTLVSGPA